MLGLGCVTTNPHHVAWRTTKAHLAAQFSMAEQDNTIIQLLEACSLLIQA